MSVTECQSSIDLSRLVELFHAFNSATTQDEVLLLIERFKGMLDVDGVAFLHLIFDDGQRKIVNMLTADFGTPGVNSEWTQVYQSKKFQNIDPLITRAISSPKAFNWQEYIDSVGALSPIETEFLNFSMESGLVSGASVGMVSNKAHHQELNLIAVSGRDLVADQLAALELMCAIVERSLLKLPSSESRLTAREREILCWAAEGKTNWDIGMILGISERTVKFHFSNIFLKLSVQNRPQAVVMGIKLGHI